jgi:hypothetical protein
LGVPFIWKLWTKNASIECSFEVVNADDTTDYEKEK